MRRIKGVHGKARSPRKLMVVRATPSLKHGGAGGACPFTRGDGAKLTPSGRCEIGTFTWGGWCEIICPVREGGWFEIQGGPLESPLHSGWVPRRSRRQRASHARPHATSSSCAARALHRGAGVDSSTSISRGSAGLRVGLAEDIGTGCASPGSARACHACVGLPARDVPERALLRADVRKRGRRPVLLLPVGVRGLVL